MGLLDKIFDKDDDRDAKAKPAAKPAAPAAKPAAPAAKPAAPAAKPAAAAPRADFSDVQGASSTTAPAAAKTYTVKAGDSLSKIAQRELGDASRWQAIFAANRDTIKDPDLIHPGQVLKLPSNS